MKAIEAGNYAQAAMAMQHTAEATTQIGAAVRGFLLALAEQFDEADRIVTAANLPAIAVIVRGERQRLARWRDPADSGRLSTSQPTMTTPLYAAMGAALALRDVALADRTKADLATHGRPVAGTLTTAGGDRRPFKDLVDADDAIGRMLETYCGDGLLYFPFEDLRRIEFQPKTNFMDFLMPKVKLTTRQGQAMAYVPKLYAGSASDPDDFMRTGRMTNFDYVGTARRARGQRDLFFDSTMMGIQNVAAIDFA